MIVTEKETPVKVWARTVHGLEWIAAAEAALLPGISNIHTSHRNLFFNANNFDIVTQLRCIDDAFIIWGKVKNVDHTRLTLGNFTEDISRLPTCPLKIPRNIKKLRVTASFLGSRNYSRYDLENLAGPILARKLNLTYADSLNKDLRHAAWCRIHLDHEGGLVGLRTAPVSLHRRYWRTEGMPGLLHPPVAAAMCLLADLRPGYTVMDPFVGTGTLLIEAGLRCPDLNLVGFDISKEALERAHVHAKKANVRLSLLQANIMDTALPMSDCVISNPPWGKQVKISKMLVSENYIRKIFSHLKSDGRCIFIEDQEMKIPELLRKINYVPRLLETVRVAGRLSDLLILGDSPAFSDSPQGSILQKAYLKYRIRDTSEL